MSASEAQLKAPLPEALRALPMFDFMSVEVRAIVALSFIPVAYPFGAVIVREGEVADSLHVIVSGQARVVRTGEHGEEVPLNVLRPGDSFGEEGLLGPLRSATVRASSEVEALRLDGSVFRALLNSYPSMDLAFRTHVRRRRLQDFFRVYSAFSHLPTGALELMLRKMDALSVPKGEVVIRQGDPPGPLYVVESGRFRATKEVAGQKRDVAFLRTGDFFGERSLFAGEPRNATVQAVSDSSLLRLDSTTLQQLLAGYSEFRAEIEERVSQYDYLRVARIPLDFAEEILPATVATAEVELAGLAEGGRSPDPPEPEERPSGVGVDRKRRRIRRFPHVWGIDRMDCGAASLAMVCRHFGREVSLAHIRDVVQVGKDGASLAGICAGAEAIGLEARAVKVSPTRLDEMPLPAIVHWEGNHWLVLYDVDHDRLRVADPTRGLKRISREEFEGKWTGYSALCEYTPALEEAPEAKPSIRWIWPFFEPYKRALAAAALLALVAASLLMVIPIFAQLVVDEVVTPADPALLTPLFVGMLAVLVLMTIASVGQRFVLSRIAVRFDAAALEFLTGKLLVLPMSYFHARRTGDISRRLSGLRWAREFLIQKGVIALTAITQLVVAVALMFAYNWVLALVFLASIPAYAALMYYAISHIRPMYHTVEESFGKYHSSQIDAIKGIETVKATSSEPAFTVRMREQFAGLSHKLFRADLTIMLYEASIQTVTFLSFAICLWVGASQVLDGRMSIGELVSFNALVLLANAPIALLMLTWDEFQLSSVLLNRLNDVLVQEPEQGADHSRLMHVQTLEGRIVLRGVGFRYPGPTSMPILEDINLHVDPETKVAIVGRSGSGKTTLVKCLAGLIEPTMGTISYDGVDLRQLNYQELRRHIGFVLQEPYLFDDTIARNIASRDEDASFERIEQAARIAAAHEFIERLPLGYETPVGETGLLLSGGQRQRIAIARALYHRPPVLIFDEATSSLDSESERAVQDSIEHLLSGRTSFVIAHRMSTIRSADLVVVLERGRIVERGTHDELMRRQGLYYYLASQQLES